MKKALLLGLSVMMVSGVAVAQNEGEDYRSSWAKSQDMYVEPTLRITETTFQVTPEQAAQQNLSTREVPEGTVLNQSQSTVIGPDGQVIQQSSDSAVTPAPMPATQTQPGAPVEDLTRSVQ